MILKREDKSIILFILIILSCFCFFKIKAVEGIETEKIKKIFYKIEVMPIELDLILYYQDNKTIKKIIKFDPITKKIIKEIYYLSDGKTVFYKCKYLKTGKLIKQTFYNVNKLSTFDFSTVTCQNSYYYKEVEFISAKHVGIRPFYENPSFMMCDAVKFYH